MDRFRARRDDDGFSMIELLVVIIVIGILAAIAIPVFLSQRTKGSDATVKADLRNLATGEEAYQGDNKTYSNDVNALGGQGSRTSAGNSFQLAGSATRYCIVGASNRSTSYYAWDNTTGGLKPGSYPSLAAAKAATACATDTWAGSLT